MKKYICNRKTYKEFIQYELNKYGKWGGMLRFIPVLFFEGQVVVRHQILLRKAELYCNTGHKLLGMIYRMRLSRLQTRYGGMTIPLNVFDKGLYVLHVGPRNINGNAVVGKNCALHTNVGLVAGGHNSGAPSLGDNVVIGTGAVVLGDVSIADGIAIGANAVVNKDFTEKNIAIAGVPAKKISNNGSSTWNPQK